MKQKYEQISKEPSSVCRTRKSSLKNMSVLIKYSLDFCNFVSNHFWKIVSPIHQKKCIILAINSGFSSQKEQLRN